MKVDCSVTVFTVSPLADPARGGRWCSLQFWRDQGTPRVTQLCDYKWRIATPEDRDPSAEIQERVRSVLGLLRGDVEGVERNDRIVLSSVYAEG